MLCCKSEGTQRTPSGSVTLIFLDWTILPLDSVDHTSDGSFEMKETSDEPSSGGPVGTQQHKDGGDQDPTVGGVCPVPTCRLPTHDVDEDDNDGEEMKGKKPLPLLTQVLRKAIVHPPPAPSHSESNSTISSL
jgi:hypothetical protein